MKDIRVDSDGELRCWNCGQRSFKEKRTMRAKVAGGVTVGVGMMATKKKMQCRVCNEYNDTGSAKPYTGPASKKYKKMFGDD